MEATMETTRGQEALERLLRLLVQRTEDGLDARHVAAEAWPEFKAAVGAAQEELRAAELEGVQRWQRARHG